MPFVGLYREKSNWQSKPVASGPHPVCRSLYCPPNTHLNSCRADPDPKQFLQFCAFLMVLLKVVLILGFSIVSHLKHSSPCYSLDFILCKQTGRIRTFSPVFLSHHREIRAAPSRGADCDARGSFLLLLFLHATYP